MFDARSVANFLLDYGDRTRQRVTILKLLKIIFFAHGLHLAHRGHPLIRQKFEAWQLGPVVRVVYDCFKGSDAEILGRRATRLDPVTGEVSIVHYAFDESTSDFLREVFDLYSRVDTFHLSNLTHQIGTPWERVWNSVSNDVHLGMRISDDAIKDYFLRQEKNTLFN